MDFDIVVHVSTQKICLDPRYRKKKTCEEKTELVCAEVPVTECEVTYHKSIMKLECQMVISAFIKD